MTPIESILPHLSRISWAGSGAGPVSGFGLHLLKQVFSVVEHSKLPDGNEWHLAKPLVS